MVLPREYLGRSSIRYVRARGQGQAAAAALSHLYRQPIDACREARHDPAHRSRTGAQILIDQLKIHGADTLFCVPGESYLAALDAMYDANSIRLVICRQEGGAAMMADAYGKLTGRPGICFVTRGPGACNASAGVHIAMQDSTPLILFIGQVARGTRGREAFQEVDYRADVRHAWRNGLTRSTIPRRVPELVSRAFHIATGGRPGPVVLALPEDMLTEDGGGRRRAALCAGRAASRRRPRCARSPPRSRRATRPIMLLGGSQWDAATRRRGRDIRRAPTSCRSCCGFRRQDRFDNAHPCYAGDVGLGVNPKLGARLRDADLLIVVGARLGEATSGGYTLVDIPVPQPAPRPCPSRSRASWAASTSRSSRSTPRRAASPPRLRALAPVADPPWAATATAGACATISPGRSRCASPGALQMSEIVRWLSEHLPDDAIICNGAGNFATWVHRFYRYRRFGTQLAPTSGSMGYGFPAAVAAKLRPSRPHRRVLRRRRRFPDDRAGAGDGGAARRWRSSCSSSTTAMYGTIRMHQERHYPGRVVGTDAGQSRFRRARARLWRPWRDGDAHRRFRRRLRARAWRRDGPALLELKLDPEALTITQSTSQIRAAALAQRR